MEEERVNSIMSSAHWLDEWPETCLHARSPEVLTATGLGILVTQKINSRTAKTSKSNH